MASSSFIILLILSITAAYATRVANLYTDPLYVRNEDIIAEIDRLLNGDLISFASYSDLNLFVKTEASTSFGLMKMFMDRKIIDMDNLHIDDYGVIFTKHTINTNNIYFNYLPWDNSLKQAIRISHDGYVSNCYDMFFKDYQSRAVGNIREKPVGQILEGHRLAQPEYTKDDQLIELEHTAETSSYHHRIKNAPAMQIQLEG